MMQHRFEIYFSVLVSGILALALVGCTPASPPSTDQPEPQKVAQFVGGEVCRNCHEHQQREWRGSHHDLAMQVADSNTVLGDFDDASFEYFGTTSRFYRQGDRYLVETDNAQGELESFDIVYTLGVDPIQQYIIGFPDGRMQALGIAWDTRPPEQGGARWFHLYPDEHVSHGDPPHWTGRLQNWNSMCAECHMTNFQKNYRAKSRFFASTWNEIGVSCEACHGPGSVHAAWAEGEINSTDPQLSSSLDDRSSGKWTMNDDTGTASISLPVSKAQRQPDACGRCHSRRMAITDSYEYGHPLLDTHAPALLEEGLYYPDGQIMDEVFVYSSFLQSKMYEAGVTCTDCHDPHSLRLKTDGTASSICAQCHLPAKFADSNHHFHTEDTVQCVDCHMTSTTFMLIDPRRDHSFRIPSPDLSISNGTPNACTNCHGERPNEWAAAKLNEWYGPPEKPQRHWSEAFVAARTGQAGARKMLQKLLDGGDTELAIVRATAYSLLAEPRTNGDIARLKRGLGAPDPLIRLAALQVVASLPPEIAAGIAGHLLRDPVKGVRISAVRVFAGSRSHLTQPLRDDFDRAAQEFMSMQLSAAEIPAAQTSLGDFYRDLGKHSNALAAYQRSLDLDPDWITERINSADLYSRLSQTEKAQQQLRDGLSRNPRSAPLNHALGLALVRDGQIEDALGYLALAANEQAQSVRFSYVYAIALLSHGHSGKALSLLVSLHQAAPGDFDVLWAPATIHLDRDNFPLATKYANALAVEYPDVPEVLQLLQRLGIGKPDL